MPASAQQALVCILLLWTAVLAVIQAAWLVVHFSAAGRRCPEPAGAASHEPVPFRSNLSSPREAPPQWGEGGMLTYAAVGGGQTIKWLGRHQNPELMSESGDSLAVMKDGYYFLGLQVTLSSCAEADRQINVSLKRGGRILLRGRIHPKTCSTGLLGKAEVLSAGGEALEVIVSPPSGNVDYTEALTHLDVIYMFKP
ncbi:uncharacterized protein LOC133514963 isoform X3 [Syngnathoides biaculeatus]|uniref:uncharacterized protein LOC133514963 isoform X3 n=1 Tax=Syngnathoides biaculeatus TaxID=300417 RepID=UPI002ADDDE62|nr:uncharacterized protein LOC133514963 isoform X3 [Syngnathoides biaculeatus]XP_061703102.1 uncharacterized protein LOC133514963 isoform X3 [Syngnathoides biaculeatus]XP_061703103.1 uncharacterized protein LOC133514963 isoform X3 [Syngnathoides biaculeatus]XP_061703104.1 uncharacterized protein LOC133514963 isoform X3 [Syngnathoides biaculeatus]XP_061703105.1 uncharacterized protein LOC133514963 isoform X3 [Syngnathoides biaculeatus]XP_061703106.1 uncharacterized protein LOC133514963 isoform 